MPNLIENYSFFEEKRELSKMLKINRSDIQKIQETSKFPTLTKLWFNLCGSEYFFIFHSRKLQSN